MIRNVDIYIYVYIDIKKMHERVKDVVIRTLPRVEPCKQRKL